MPFLEPVPLPVRTGIYDPRETPRYAHFLTSGMASVVTEMAGGQGVEVGIGGRESVLEALYAIGPQTGESRCFMQVAGTGLRMDFKRFQADFHRLEGLHALVLRQIQYEALITAQLAACNRLHTVEERLARWLLMVAARVGRPEVQLTQEFLGEMLGARRSTVTIAAGTLQRSGLIDYHRGSIRITNQPALQNAACECFAVTQRLLMDLF